MNKKINFWPNPGKRSGFTLIEILIVVAIIAILASVVLIGLGPTQRIGRDARRLADLRQVQTGLELYFNKCGFYPKSGTTATCPTAPTTGGSVTWSDLTGALIGMNVGVTNLPNDPTTSRSYLYGTSDGATEYVLAAQLEDTNNPALNGDVDGANVFGINCADVGSATFAGSRYCIQL